MLSHLTNITNASIDYYVADLNLILACDVDALPSIPLDHRMKKLTITVGNYLFASPTFMVYNQSSDNIQYIWCLISMDSYTRSDGLFGLSSHILRAIYLVMDEITSTEYLIFLSTLREKEQIHHRALRTDFILAMEVFIPAFEYTIFRNRCPVSSKHVYINTLHHSSGEYPACVYPSPLREILLWVTNRIAKVFPVIDRVSILCLLRNKAIRNACSVNPITYASTLGSNVMRRSIEFVA